MTRNIGMTRDIGTMRGRPWASRFGFRHQSGHGISR
jgi:hypothetical protein